MNWPISINLDSDKLPFQWDEETWGAVWKAECYCPGVYLLYTKSEGHPLSRSLYAVSETESKGIISKEALGYGTRVLDTVIYDRDAYGTGWMVLEFEIYQYWVAHSIPVPEYTDLFSTAHYASERFPEYFGMLIPPHNTPAGQTVRYKVITNGLYFVESETSRWFLAVAYCIWSSDLSEYACKIGEKTTNRADTDPKTGYLFFNESTCALAIYELLDLEEYKNLRNFISSQAALENELAIHFPLYTLIHNKMEVQYHGKNDLLKDLFLSLGRELDEAEETDEDIKKRIENCIRYTPQAEGEQWLLLPLIRRG